MSIDPSTQTALYYARINAAHEELLDHFAENAARTLPTSIRVVRFDTLDCDQSRNGLLTQFIQVSAIIDSDGNERNVIDFDDLGDLLWDDEFVWGISNLLPATGRASWDLNLDNFR